MGELNRGDSMIPYQRDPVEDIGELQWHLATVSRSASGIEVTAVTAHIARTLFPGNKGLDEALAKADEERVILLRRVPAPGVELETDQQAILAFTDKEWGAFTLGVLDGEFNFDERD